ncbi:hypothetical protein CJ030_MR2G027163 [Morella rubra]|uniref:Uncharacterized protein n=1 Tax=Morella rubra TaxID=262757 RepID=A0A6A1W8D0_9ROSI|nr:hypothetical protein CJ030_MR2G027163 [Morella rubra]
MDSQSHSPTSSPKSVLNISFAPPVPPIIAITEHPPTPPNSPQSPNAEANVFTLNCLEPLGFERDIPPVTTRYFLDSLESPVVPPSGFLGPTLEDYLESHAYSRPIRPCITLDPCPVRKLPLSSHAAPVTQPFAPSSELVPFHNPLAVDFSKCFKGKAKSMSSQLLFQVNNISSEFLPVQSFYIDKVSVDCGHSVFKPSTLPSIENNTLATAIKSIGVGLTPQPIAPHAPFFKEAVVDDCFWNSKGKRKLMEVNTEPIPPAGKKLALFLSSEDHPMDTTSAADPPF